MHTEFSKRAAVRSIIGCLLVQLCVGILYLWSMLKAPAALTLQMEIGASALVSSVMLMAFVVGCLIGGFIVDERGPRFTCVVGVVVFSVGIGLSGLVRVDWASVIYITYAGLGGLGSGIAYSACISCIQKWLPGRRGFASGLATGAFGLSTVVFAPVFRMLVARLSLEDGTLRFTPFFFTLGGVFLVLGLIGAALILTPPAAEAGSSAAGESIPLRGAIRMRAFRLIFFTVFFINGAWNLATPLLYDLGLTRGLTPALATAALSFTGVASTAGRLIMATLSDRLDRRISIILLGVLTAAASIAMMFVGGSAYIAATALLAFAYGGPSAVNAAITTDCFGPGHSGSIYGVILLALGASSVFFNLVSAHLLGGDVSSTFLMAAGTAIVPIVLMVLLRKECSKASCSAVARSDRAVRQQC